jgi:hypothetical protein
MCISGMILPLSTIFDWILELYDSVFYRQANQDVLFAFIVLDI